MTIHPKVDPSIHDQINGSYPDDRVHLALAMHVFQLTADDEVVLARLKATDLVQTSFLATVKVRAGDVNAVAELESVRGVW